MAQRTDMNPQILSLLRDGDIVNPRAILTGHNATFLADVILGDDSCQAVFKPRDGETPLWDFPDGTLYRREYLAYRVSQALAWEIVPPTVIRQGPHGIGSLQLFIDAVPEAHYFTIVETRRAHLVPMAIFDCLINNTDRKGSHVLQARSNGHLWGIDHGLAFHPQPKLRTVMWDLDEEPLPDGLRPSLHRLCDDGGLRKELTAHLSQQEVNAFYKRAEAVAAAKTLPFKLFADRWRPYPWPPL